MFFSCILGKNLFSLRSRPPCYIHGLGNHQENDPLILLKGQLIMPLAASTLNIQGLITHSEQHLIVADNLVSPECVTPPRLLNTAVRGGVTNFATFTCLHHANNPNVK